MIERLLFVFLVASSIADAQVAEPNVENDSPSETYADLSDLTSSDADVRRKSLYQLAREIQSGSGGPYSNHGQALLPALTQVILDLDDRHARNALDAIHWMGVNRRLLEQLGERDLDDVDRRDLEEARDRINDYPVPSEYPPLKDALINVLMNSRDSDARSLAAISLANGFQPISDLEDVLVAQLPIEESNGKVQSAIIGGLSTIMEHHTVKRTTELAIVKAMASSNMTTRRSAVEALRRYQFDGALEGVINNLSGDITAYEFDNALNSISLFNQVDDSHIAQLEDVSDNIDNEKRKKEIQKTVQTLRHRTTDRDHHFGLLELTQSSILLHTAHRGLTPNTRITVVGSDFALFVSIPVDPEEKLSRHVRINSLPTTSYYVGSFGSSVPVEAIENAVVYFPLDSTKYSSSKLSHTSCTSDEGIHHSVWLAEDAENVRVWSAYHYLEYSTESTCSDGELAEY